MLRLVGYFLAIAVAAYGMSWLYDNRGSIVVDWQGIVWYTDAFQVTILLALLAITLLIVWTVMRGVWQSPATIGNFFNRRREKRGLEALSSGMIAIGAGDKALATRYAVQARKSLPNEPMTHLLRAQAAQLAGDRTTSRRIFEAMLGSPDTEALGLRGLFLEAEREGEKVAARQFAERAVRLNPKLVWPVDALFDIQCREGDWGGALETLSVAKKNGHVEKPVAERRRAVLLTAQAQEAEDSDPERAMNLALEAHKLAVDLVPAAAIAGRLLASRGNTPKAAGILQKTWRKSPHPELAVAYAYARLGDSPRDRLERLGQLAALTPNVIESPIAIANAAIEAKSYDAARKALEPLIEGRLTQRVCTLMARIESEEHGNTVAVREWLARAVNAPRDPAWTADGIVSEHWAAVSPVTGALDAFQWRVPVEAAEPRDKEFLAQKIEELVALGTRPEAMIVSGATPVAAPPSPTEGHPAQPRPSVSTPRADAVDVEVVEVRPQSQNSVGGPSRPEPGQQSDRPVDAGGPAAGKSAPAAPKAAAEGGGSPEVRAPTETAEQDARGVSASQPAAGRGVAAAQGASPAPSNSPPVAKPEPRSGVEPSGQTSGPIKEPVGKIEPKIFVPPRAPDDPGPESADEIPSGLRSGSMR